MEELDQTYFFVFSIVLGSQIWDHVNHILFQSCTPCGEILYGKCGAIAKKNDWMVLAGTGSFLGFN